MSTESDNQDSISVTQYSKRIQQIDVTSVHKICSSQVVCSLSTAVKELVENSIDANATLITVKLKNEGLDGIEVSDNGIGVHEKNFEGLTAKYHTSKIENFSDLSNVGTLGFRGEALSSLCAVSEMVISTRCESAHIGTRLILDHNGVIKEKIPCAREVGTSVTLTNLFNTLPVRKRELKRNIKKEFKNVYDVLKAYGIVSKGIRIICTNQTAKGMVNTFMSTHGSENALDNIISIFGIKLSKNLVRMQPQISNEKRPKHDESVLLFSDDIDNLNVSQYEIDGWISTCKHGCGRSERDQQFFFINSRPCDLKFISKMINNVYHSYNEKQWPFVYLNLKMDPTQIDVNLTPDKRKILIHKEKTLLLAIRMSLEHTFRSIASTYEINHKSYKIDESFLFESSKSVQQSTLDDSVNLQNLKRKIIELTDKTLKPRKVQKYSSSSRMNETSFSSNNSDNEKELNLTTELPNITDIKKKSEIFDQLLQNNDSNCLYIGDKSETITSHENCAMTLNTEENKTCESKEIEEIRTSNSIEEIKSFEAINCMSVIDLDKSDTENEYSANSKFHEFQVSIDELKLMTTAEKQFQKDSKNKGINLVKFKAEINPKKNKNAEEELQREISHEMFSNMAIIGQFNLGFIIAKLNDDLFIIDQHATDEIFNFETLQKTVVLQYQKLMIPESLELSIVHEMVLIDNMNIFEANGFKFEIDHNAPPTKRVKIIGKPYSKNWAFGKSDIADLIFMLDDVPEDTMCRPPRVRDMFASRACRQSVMIGKALTNLEMRKLIDHMADVEKPWNCPHGRPTMRHLTNLSMLAYQRHESL